METPTGERARSSEASKTRARDAGNRTRSIFSTGHLLVFAVAEQSKSMIAHRTDVAIYGTALSGWVQPPLTALVSNPPIAGGS
jgi:hypothetical protein